VRLLGIAHTKLHTKFEVSSSSSFEDMFDVPRPLSGKLFMRPLGIFHTKLRTKFEVSSPSSFRHIAL